jgi:hypothetical protein
MLEDEVLAILTPWNVGGNFLPHQEDLDRLAGLTPKLYLTAMPALKRATKDRDVERLIGRLHKGDLKQLKGWGHVRARRGPGDNDWSVECDGDATEVGA